MPRLPCTETYIATKSIAMASSPLLLFVVLLCSYCLIALGGNEHGFVVVPTSTSTPSAAACSPAPQVASDPNRASMPLAHRHGPCAPASSAAATSRLSRAEMLRRDRARRNHILAKASGRRTITVSDVGVSIPTALGAAVDSLEYVVTLGIGTPAVQQTVLMDTGSDLTWVQCKPCNSSTCYPQKDPVFDPSASSTYAPVPCDSKACRDLVPDSYNHGCTSNSSGGVSLCQYGIQYGNLDTTVGVYSTETLTLSPQVSVKSFGFGCGLDQRGQFDLFDGLLGLGGAPESLVSQTAETYGGAFSYCLPSGNSTTGFLALGAPSNSNNTAEFQFTPLHSVPEQATFYLVNLTGISLGGKPLDIPPTALAGGMILDSGTVVTFLPETAYAPLRTAFRSAMSAYPLLPPNDDEGLDTCFNFTGHSNVTVPTVALAFDGGVTIELDVPSGVLVEDCLAFAGGGAEGEFGIIGNVNQRTFEVFYDSGRGHVGFRPGAC